MQYVMCEQYNVFVGFHGELSTFFGAPTIVITLFVIFHM